MHEFAEEIVTGTITKVCLTSKSLIAMINW